MSARAVRTALTAGFAATAPPLHLSPRTCVNGALFPYCTTLSHTFVLFVCTGNEVAGTPGYMAIEVEQKGTADALSDVFSAGVTLLELWVGSIGPTFDEYEGVDEVGPEGAWRL